MRKGRCLVTGGAGFIGSYLVKYLIAEGHSVTVIDNLSTGKIANVAPEVDFIELNLGHPHDLTSYLKDVEMVFHLAALPRVTESFETPIQYEVSNVRSTLYLLMAMIEAQNINLIVSSSSAIYGNPKQLPTPETAPTAPLSPYALQKFMSEQYALIIGEQNGINVKVLRQFNVYGPHSCNPKDSDNTSSSVINVFRHRKKCGQTIEVTGDGEQRRDFVHVNDVVEANYLAAISNKSGHVFNVGTGKTTSINELAGMLANSWTYTPERIGEPRVSLADISKIRDELSWKPRLTLKNTLNKN